MVIAHVTIRARKVKNGWSLYLDIIQNGFRKCLGLHLTVSKNYPKMLRDGKKIRIEKKDKEAWLRANNKKTAVENDLNKGEFGIVENKNIDFIEFFERICKEKNNRSYNGALYQLKKFISHKLTMKQVSYSFLKGFRQYLLKKVRSPNTAKTYMDRLRIVLNEAINEGYIKENPCNKLPKIKTVEPVIDYLEVKELQLMCDKKAMIKDQKVVHAFLFSCFTGIRFSDLERIEWQQIKNNELTFRQQKVKKLLTIPLGESALMILDEWKKFDQQNTNHIFGKLPINANANKVLKSWAKQTGIKKNSHFHVGRHTFAIMALRSSKDLFTVSKLLGHANLQTTMKYLKYVKEEGRKAVSILPDISL